LGVLWSLTSVSDGRINLRFAGSTFGLLRE
jgi:hypothetical protein